jgi:hypothetical protein
VKIQLVFENLVTEESYLCNPREWDFVPQVGHLILLWGKTDDSDDEPKLAGTVERVQWSMSMTDCSVFIYVKPDAHHRIQ